MLEYCVRKGILTTWNEVSCWSLLKVVDVVKQKTSSVWRREREKENRVVLRKWGACVRNSAC